MRARVYVCGYVLLSLVCVRMRARCVAMTCSCVNLCTCACVSAVSSIELLRSSSFSFLRVYIVFTSTIRSSSRLSLLRARARARSSFRSFSISSRDCPALRKGREKNERAERDRQDSVSAHRSRETPKRGSIFVFFDCDPIFPIPNSSLLREFRSIDSSNDDPRRRARASRADWTRHGSRSSRSRLRSALDLATRRNERGKDHWRQR